MSTFEDRQNAFENKYAHDAEMLFKAEARANKLLGHWAAGLLGKTDDAEVAAYATEVVKSDFEEPGDDDVIRKVKGDLGDLATEEEIRSKRQECLAQAKAQLAE